MGLLNIHPLRFFGRQNPKGTESVKIETANRRIESFYPFYRCRRGLFALTDSWIDVLRLLPTAPTPQLARIALNSRYLAPSFD